MKFSVIIPAYNVYDYLSGCVDSVAQQITKDEFSFEVILVNDGSTDNQTPALCDELARKYNNIIVIHQENSGLSAARNSGIRKSAGDYILFVDGDDFWSDKEFLYKIFQHLESNQVDLVQFSYSLYYSSSSVIALSKGEVFSRLDFESNIVELVSKRIFCPSACSKVIHRKFFDIEEMFFPVGFLSEDCLWSGELLKKVQSCSVFTSSQYMYRQNRPNSITSVIKEKNILDILKSIKIGLQDDANFSSNISTAMRIYYCISYLSVIPSIYKYRENHFITDSMEELNWLNQYSKYIKDNDFRYRGMLVSCLGLKGSIFLLGKVKVFYNIIRKLR